MNDAAHPLSAIRDTEARQYQKKSHMTKSHLYHDEQLPVPSQLTDIRKKHLHPKEYKNYAEDESQMPHEAT